VAFMAGPYHGAFGADPLRRRLFRRSASRTSLDSAADAARKRRFALIETIEAIDLGRLCL
jgi:hypothetical protein